VCLPAGQQQQHKDITNAADFDDKQFNFDTIHNIDVSVCELSPTLRGTIHAWNKTIQYWMAAYIYKRLPFHSNPLKVTLTMLVSAYWHGLYPGYYLTFLSASFYLYVEQTLQVGTTSSNSQRHLQPTTGWRRWLA
jgi:lysophospholipid acyltransferase 7